MATTRVDSRRFSPNRTVTRLAHARAGDKQLTVLPWSHYQAGLCVWEQLKLSQKI